MSNHLDESSKFSNQPVLHTAGIREMRFGKDVEIVEPVNLYGSFLDDHCFVGPFTEIQQNVSVGKRTRIQSHCFICEGVSIGEDCFIAHAVVFTNDDFKTGGPASKTGGRLKPTRIGARVSIGSNCSLLPVVVCDDVVIGAGSVVVEDIREPGFYAGNPAKKIRNK